MLDSDARILLGTWDGERWIVQPKGLERELLTAKTTPDL